METAARVEHRPPDQLSLEVEHAWVTEALNHAHDAVEGAHRTALRVAREHWPEQWTKLEPRLVTLASWVGYDQDGRTDITWTRTIAARLADKLAMIERHLKKVEVLERSASDSDFLAALQPLRSMLALGECNCRQSDRIGCGGGARSNGDGRIWPCDGVGTLGCAGRDGADRRFDSTPQCGRRPMTNGARRSRSCTPA